MANSERKYEEKDALHTPEVISSFQTTAAALGIPGVAIVTPSDCHANPTAEVRVLDVSFHPQSQAMPAASHCRCNHIHTPFTQPHNVRTDLQLAHTNAKLSG